MVEQLHPGIVLPMHYKTDYIDLPISKADEFLKKFPGYRVKRELEVTAGSLPAERQVVLLELKS